jgi:hypothetical protein
MLALPILVILFRLFGLLAHKQKKKNYEISIDSYYEIKT